MALAFERLSVTLQQAGEFRVAVRYVRIAIDQSGNDIAENGEREIDTRGLFETIALNTEACVLGRTPKSLAYRRAGLRLTFTAGQVDKVQLADANMCVTIGAHLMKRVRLVRRVQHRLGYLTAFDGDDENSV